MLVLHFITGLKIGGAETTLYNLLLYWTKTTGRHEKHVVLFLYDGPYVERIRNLGISVYQINGLVSPYDPIGLYRLIKFVKKMNPDLIHSALWSANIMARLVAKWCKIPLISDLHGNCEHYGVIRNFIGRWGISIPKKYVAVSDGVKSSFEKRFGIVPVTIKNGIDPERTRACADERPLTRDDLKISHDSFVIGAVGRLHSIKRYDRLIRAVSKLIPRANLILVGGGPERRGLESLVDELGVGPFVHFVGEQANPYPYYRLFDCFVISSQSEGLSIALLEALTFGLPIVTTSDVDHAVSHEVVSNGENGYVVDHSVNSLVDALERLISDDRLVSSMKYKNRKLVEEFFHIGIVSRQYENLYEKSVRKE